MVRRTNRKSVRTFWVRNTGAWGVSTTNASAAQGATLFDPLLFLPDPTVQRVDIQRDVTLMAMHFNYTADYNDGDGIAHTNFLTDFYFGICKEDRNAPNRSPAFSTVDDARTDWLDLWMDSCLAPAANATASTATTFQGAKAVSRFVRTKRILQSEDLIVASSVYFPHEGVLPQNSTLKVQWQMSALLRMA